MTYLDYILFFEKQDRQQPKGFSGNVTRLYVKLLAIANGIALANGGSWPEEFSKSDPYVAKVAGMAANTMKECRDKLVAGGLLAGSWGEQGFGKLGVYRLLGDEKRLSNFDSLSPERVSNFDSLPPERLSEFDSLPPERVSNFDSLPPQIDQNPAERLSNFDTLYKEHNKEGGSAAIAALSAPAASPKKSAPAAKSSTAKTKQAGASHEEVAALPLPFEGEAFAEAWRTFYTENPKQKGKALSAFRLMLKKLGKYPEGFAVVMLEKAIMGNWSGVENDGTTPAFETWKASQARHPAAEAPAPDDRPLPNPEFLAQQAAAAAAEEADHLARYATAA